MSINTHWPSKQHKISYVPIGPQASTLHRREEGLFGQTENLIIDSFEPTLRAWQVRLRDSNTLIYSFLHGSMSPRSKVGRSVIIYRTFETIQVTVHHVRIILFAFF